MELPSATILKQKGVHFRLIELNSTAISVQDVIQYAKEKITPDEICKTIIAKDENENSFAFLLKGKDKINFAKTKEIVGAKASIANSDEVKEIAGVEPGAVCPLLLKIPIFVEYGLEIYCADLEKVVSFKIADIAK